MNLNKELAEQGLDLSQLPTEIQHYIFRFLDARSLSIFGMTSKSNLRLVIELLKKWQSTLLNIKLIAGDCSIFLYTPDELYACGDNVRGSLGLCHEEGKITTYQPVKNLTGKIQEVFTNGITTYAVTTDGLFGCGENKYGKLGTGDTINRNSFIKIPLPQDKILQVVQAYAHTFVLTDQALYGCGNNKDGQLGFTDRTNITTFQPIAVPGKSKKVATSIHSSFVLTDEGLFVSGNNKWGQLGLGDTQERLVFTKVKNIPEKIQDVIAGTFCSFLITDEGLYACGRNVTGMLGLGDFNDHSTFTKVDRVKGKVKQVNIQDEAILVLAGQVLYAFGENIYYSLPGKHPWAPDHLNQRSVDLGRDYEAIHVGKVHTFISSQNSLLMCVNGFKGQMGLGKVMTLNPFGDIKCLFPGNIQQIITHRYHSLIIGLTDKGIYSFGYNHLGMLGLGDVKEAEKVTKLDKLPIAIEKRFENYRLIQSLLKIASKPETNNTNMNDFIESTRKRKRQ